MSDTPGRFITLEGGEGVGKSTQARLLQDALQLRGINALLTREPGGSGGAEAIRELLLGGDDERWNIRTEALLFAAARADHVRRTIKPALAVGRWVICDRFIDSSRAYQGAAGLIGDEDIMALHRFGSRGVMPDRTIVLTLSLDEATERVRRRDGDSHDRIARRPDDYHLDVSSFFLTLAQSEPGRVRAVDASGTTEDVAGRVLASITDLF